MPESTKAQITFGRYQTNQSLALPGTEVLYLENVRHDSDFWITVAAEDGLTVLGHLKFKVIGPNQFVLADIRPAHCPIRDLSIACKQSSGPRPKGS